MDSVYKNVEQYNCVVRAYRLARWANHAWGLLPDGAIAEVWNICPSVKAFCDLVPGYAVARGWIADGPAGYGVWKPAYAAGELIVTIGSHGQIEARISRGRTVIVYQRHDRYAAAGIVNGVVAATGYHAEPRYWARVGRLLIVAEQPTDVEAEGIREALRKMAGEEPAALGEFDRYFSLTGPEILAGPEVIAA